MIHNFDDYLLESLINEDLLTEKLSFDKIKEIVSSIRNKKSFLKKILSKYNLSKDLVAKKNIAMLIAAMFVTGCTQHSRKDMFCDKDKIEDVSNDLVKFDVLSEDDVNRYIDYHKQSIELDKSNDIPISDNDINYVDPQTLSLSAKGLEFIKNEELLKLVAYDLNDGRITIGYGHTMLKSTSKYKVGDKITKKEALHLLDKDLKYFEKSIKRMFRQWKQNGYDVKITQGMYDALISMSYNMGITRLRNTEFIEHLMNGNYDVASELIPEVSLNNVKYPGLKPRREREQLLFTDNI
jgi:lysozyme